MPIYKLLVILVATAFIFVACTKENTDVRLDPKLSTSQVLDVKSDSATVIGFVIAEGSGIAERGVCYSTEAEPKITDSKVAFTGSKITATFTINLGGLNYATKYYVRAYAVMKDASLLYGEEFNFTTLPIVPALTTATVSAITGNSATTGGEVTITGGADVTARGVCYAETANPTITDSKTSDGTGAGVFTSNLTGLKGNTTYHIRAYATNSAGTGYGPDVTFKTVVDLPTVTTAAVTDITKTSATSGGEVTYDGGGTVTARGLAWSTNANPTTSDNVIAGGSGTGAFVSNLTGLTKYTTYHVRAYATNSAGTAYGEDLSFLTLADTRVWNIPGDYVEASYPGSGLANWSPDKSPQVKSTISAPDNLEGYVYMANASNQWKFATQNDWSGPNYGGSVSAGILDPSGDNYNSPAGYYKLNADAAALTFTAVATVWGVIGDATPGGWGDETALEYYPSLQTWRGGVHCTAASFKFRANHDWGYNYGSTAGNNTLVAGGSNIALNLEADYYFVLDLSHPNAYTYTANRWGIIGDATAGGWGSDQDMTWDPATKVMKATLALTTGSIKFRANDDWAINLGGDLGALTQDGPNIPITTAGTYTITLDLGKAVPSCTITMKKKK